ncbi:MAG: hypothetical protein R2726_02045 [Acidimicrobiales bacterium]
MEGRADQSTSPDGDRCALVLLGLRLTSFAPTERVASVVGLSVEEAAPHLDAALDAGWARHREGRLSGWVLTAAGRAEGERLLAEELDRVGARDEVHRGYRRFLALNGRCLQVCTDWQLRADGDDQVVNDHTDADYDAAVIDRLATLHDEIRPVLGELAAALPRFGTYVPRFSSARARVEAGEHEWFTRPDLDSFHTVWFELHEHLLATLGIDRATEAG